MGSVLSRLFARERSNRSPTEPKAGPPSDNKAPLWSSPAEFDPAWSERIGRMASYIRGPAVVADFGCGMMWLEKFLQPGQTYLPIDYIRRDQRTLVLDLNRDSLEGVRGDVAFLSGVLEYVKDVPTFVRKLSASPVGQIILSYCTVDKHPDLRIREGLNWVSHESLSTLLQLFLQHFDLTAIDDVRANTILVFERKRR